MNQRQNGVLSVKRSRGIGRLFGAIAMLVLPLAMHMTIVRRKRWPFSCCTQFSIFSLCYRLVNADTDSVDENGFSPRIFSGLFGSYGL